MSSVVYMCPECGNVESFKPGEVEEHEVILCGACGHEMYRSYE